MILDRYWVIQVPWNGRRQCGNVAMLWDGPQIKSTWSCSSPEMKQRSCWNRRGWQMRARVDKGGVIVAALGWRAVLRIEGDSRSRSRSRTAEEESCDGWRDSATVVILVSRRKIASGERPEPHRKDKKIKTSVLYRELRKLLIEESLCMKVDIVVLNCQKWN